MRKEFIYANNLLSNNKTPYIILDRGKHAGKIAEVTEAARYSSNDYLQVRLVEGDNKRKFSFRIWNKCPEILDEIPTVDGPLEDFLGQELRVGDPVYIGRADIQMLGRITALLVDKVMVQPIIHRYKKNARAWNPEYCLKVSEEMAVLKNLMVHSLV